MHEYHERRLVGEFDAAALAVRLAGSGLFEEYVVYERTGTWWFAGDALAEVVADHQLARLRQGGRERTMPLGDRPIERVGELLDEVEPRGWRAFGWTGFDFGRPGGEGIRLRLLVPRTEVRLTATELVVRTLDHWRHAEIEHLVATPERAAVRPARPLDVDVDRDRYQAKVAEAVTAIRRGAVRKVILSRVVDVPFDVDVPATYLVGRRHNTPARSFLLDLGGWQVAGFSPETVAEVSPDGTVCTQALAGTRAFHDDEATDEALRRELESDPKEVYEHAASVKLACEELASVCAAGSVAVTDFMTVRNRGSVQHLGSRVRGRLVGDRRGPVAAFGALQALFPAVTASGIPKAAAFEQIDRLEDQPRGLYAGAVLMAGADGDLDAALVLRALFRSGGRTWLRAGAGIVADSRPAREYEETCEKLRSVAPHLVATHDRDHDLVSTTG